MTVQDLKRLLAIFPWDRWMERFQEEFKPLHEQLLTAGGEAGAHAAGGSFDVEAPEVQAFADRYIGERIVQLDETTRTDVVDLLERTWSEAQAAETGPTAFELGTLIADTVRERFAGYERWRADRIARTESGIAFNTGSLFGYRQNGLTRVEVSDGDSDPECEAVNGRVWTLEEAMANPLGHPNCEREFHPAPEDEPAED
jgi:hypothetical protein